MFESTTLNLPELAARWGKTQRQILEHAASMALPLCFNFDGLVIDGRGQRIMQFDADHKREHETLTAFIYESESKMQRRISGMLRDGESLTTPQAIELRKEITAAQEKKKAIEDLFDVVTRERQKYHYRGLLIATPETVDKINRLGFDGHPIWALSLDMKRVRLEPAATPWKDRLEPADMLVTVADVVAIETAAKARQTAPAIDAAAPAPVVAALVTTNDQGDTPLLPIQRARAQDAAILGEIRRQGLNPLELPKNAAGKKGVKHGIRAAIGNSGLFTGTTVFNKAWERLTGNSEIAIKG